MSDTGSGPFMMAIPMEALRGQQRNPAPAKAPASDLAAAMELSAAWKVAQQPRTVRPGELCQERETLGAFTDCAPVMMLWRMLDLTDWYDRMIIEDTLKTRYGHRFDCLVARKLSDGSIHTFTHETWRLEPYTGPRETPEAP